MQSISIELCGWTGALALIVAYALVSFERITARGPIFQLLNLAGSLMMAANSAWHHAWPSAAVNLIWISVGLGALARNLKTNATQQPL